LGASGDTITVSSDSIKANTFKDAGGNTLFTSDGAGTLSSVNSALSGGGPVLISTSTASNVSSVDITSGIDSTYDEYMFVLTDLSGVSSGTLLMQFNAVGGSGFNESVITSYFQAQHRENDSESGLAYSTGYDAAGTAYATISSYIHADSDAGASGILHLYNPSSTTYVKHFHSRVTAMHHEDRVTDVFVGGYINTTAAIDEISFKHLSSNLDSGTIQMYGIK